MPLLRLCALVLVVASIASTRTLATSYPPVTFAELVTGADIIFVGEVTDVRPFALTTRDGTVIKTRVIFRVTDPISGIDSALTVLDFFGGELNGVGMAIAGMPRFAPGERRVVFARRATSINPIVGFTQGLLQIQRDSNGEDRVHTLDGVPLSQPERVGMRGAARDAAGRPVVPMRLSELRPLINRALVEARRR